MSTEIYRDIAKKIHQAHISETLLHSGEFKELLDAEAAMQVAKHLDSIRDPLVARRVGWKLGYTSEALRHQMGISQPNRAPIYRDNSLPSRSHLPRLIHPRAEAEVALIVSEDLSWSEFALLSEDEQLELIETKIAAAYCSIEIVDSIWADYKFTWEENTADQSSAANVILGDRIQDASRLEEISVSFKVFDISQGEPGKLIIEESGESKNVFGHPLRALLWLIQDLSNDDESLESGSLILTGGITRAIPIKQGTKMQAKFVSSDSVHFVEVNDGKRKKKYGYS